MRTRSYISLCLPFGAYIHFAGIRRIGESWPCYDKGLIHYNRRKRQIGRTMRSFFGEPNHYDIQGRCVGYSRSAGLLKVAHYSNSGECIGYTYDCLRIVLIHRFTRRFMFI